MDSGNLATLRTSESTRVIGLYNSVGTALLKRPRIMCFGGPLFRIRGNERKPPIMCFDLGP